MDSVTKQVAAMYSRFPYPSPVAERKSYNELANLLKFFRHETGIGLAGKKILDAGTGAGHRLLEAASAFPETEFLGIDISGCGTGYCPQDRKGEQYW